MTGMIRQGDVLLRPTKKALRGKPVEADGKYTVIARGEGSGHAHVLRYSQAVMYRDSDGAAMLDVKADTKLMHLLDLGKPTGEHSALEVPKGTYDVLQQRGLSPEQAPETRAWD